MILAFDTSSAVCTVCLLRAPDAPTSAPQRPTLVAAVQDRSGAPQTKLLLGFVDGLLEEVGEGPDAIEAVVVGTGPGTFTGVRIGVATARALGLALGVPVYGRSTLGAVAAAAVHGGAFGAGCDVVVPVVDARRGQVFAVAYVAREARVSGAVAPEVGERASGVENDWIASTDGGVWDAVGGIGAFDPADLAGTERLGPRGVGPSRVVFVGHAGLVPPAVGQALPVDVDAAFLVIGRPPLPSRAHTGDGDRPGGPGSPESVVPVYVRDPDADLHITKMRDPWA